MSEIRNAEMYIEIMTRGDVRGMKETGGVILKWLL
jgi:hypothetical protein